MSWTFVSGIQLLSARGPHLSLWAIQALPEVPQSTADSMTGSMMLGAAVLVATQLIIVAVAAIWYLRSRPRPGHEPTSRGPSLETERPAVR